MNESLINVLSTILNGLAALSPSKSNKRKIGKTLARLCINLDDLCRDAIAEARRQLSEINKINREIRGILVSSFDIDEII